MRYSLIIPAWNEAAFIADTLVRTDEAMRLLHETTEHRGELIVVDNNSSDNTAEIARDHGAHVVFEQINQIARARNRGAAVASGEALIFLDADSRCTHHLLVFVLDLLSTGKVVGGGSEIAPDRPLEGVARQGLECWNRIARHADLAAGCFIFCRRDAFEAVGGFSDRLYAGEEIFLSRALKRWGRQRSMRFVIARQNRVVTSVRKLDWYSPAQLTRQLMLTLIPGAIFSKTLCRTWYDHTDRSKHLSQSVDTE